MSKYKRGSRGGKVKHSNKTKKLRSKQFIDDEECVELFRSKKSKKFHREKALRKLRLNQTDRKIIENSVFKLKT